MGRTGAGKTTLVNLVTRFYDPTRGAVLLDGADLRRWRLDDLRRQFAIVLQEPVLFSTSIAENIAYGRAEAGESEIEDAARTANAHDFVSALRDGYATEVGERGMRLSGGERQRIALARAFLKDAPILILDEPTSAVDLKTEQGIIEALERLMHGRTTFIIAHRLSTLQHCDVIYAVENGRLTSVSIEASEPLLANPGLGFATAVATNCSPQWTQMRRPSSPCDGPRGTSPSNARDGQPGRLPAGDFTCCRRHVRQHHLWGGIGAIIDHSKGNAGYNYPDALPVKIGQSTTVDRRDEQQAPGDKPQPAPDK